MSNERTAVTMQDTHITESSGRFAPTGSTSAFGSRSADEMLGSDLERRDLVRWGPIIAGLVTVIGLLAILSALGLAIGLSAVGGDSLGQISTGAWIWGIASAVVAFFVGGLVAAMSSAVGGRDRGLLNGLMVGATAITATLLLIGFGAGSLLGAGASALGDVVDVGQQLNVGQEVDTATNALARAESSAWGSFIGLTLAVLLAGAGGVIGARGRATGEPVRR